MSSPMDICDSGSSSAYSPVVPSAPSRSASDYTRMLQQAALLNTVGVTALMSVNVNDESTTDTCLQVFNEALGLMEQVSECPFLQKVCQNVPCVWNIIQATDPLRDDRFFVCSQALMFNPTSKDQQPSTEPNTIGISEVDLSFYSAVIIFNMALAYHQKASLKNRSPYSIRNSIHKNNALFQQNTDTDTFWNHYDQDNSMDPVHLQSALQLYDHCHQILTTILSPPGDDTDMLKLVTLNNQAQIQYALQNFGKAQSLLHDIRQLCPVLLKSNLQKSLQQEQSSQDGTSCHPRPSAFNSFYNVQTMKEISMNALLVTGPPTAASTA